MPKSRLIAGSQTIFTGPSPATGYHWASGVAMPGAVATDPLVWQSSGLAGNAGGQNLLKQLYRVQSVDWDFNIPRQTVSQFGEFAPIDQIILQAPTVSANITYLLSNFYNEASGLGFTVCPTGALGPNVVKSAISGILSKVSDEKNYFIKISREGVDGVNDQENTNLIDVVGIGNGFISSYSANFAVGELPTVTVGIEGLNLTVERTVSGASPAVNPSAGTRMTAIKYRIPPANSSTGTNDLAISALRPGDVTFTIAKRSANEEFAVGTYDIVGADLANITDARVQSANIGFSLSRTSIEKLGSKFAVSKELTFPLEITAAVDVVATDLLTGSIDYLVNCDNSYDLFLKINRPSTCAGGTPPIIAQYIIKNAKLQSENSRLTIDANQTISLNFISQVGGPNQLSKGIFLSGTLDPSN